MMMITLMMKNFRRTETYPCQVRTQKSVQKKGIRLLMYWPYKKEKVKGAIEMVFEDNSDTQVVGTSAIAVPVIKTRADEETDRVINPGTLIPVINSAGDSVIHETDNDRTKTRHAVAAFKTKTRHAVAAFKTMAEVGHRRITTEIDDHKDVEETIGIILGHTTINQDSAVDVTLTR